MIDNGLILASNENLATLPAPGAISAASAALDLDLSGTTPQQRAFSDPGSGRDLVLDIYVNTAFTTAANLATFEIELLSIPIKPSLLTAATPAGALLSADIPVTIATETLTLAAHELPVGAAVRVTALAGALTIVGAVLNETLYVTPTGADTFRLSSTLALAIAGTPDVTFAGGNADATVEFIATHHGSTGPLEINNLGTSNSPLQANERIRVRLNPIATRTPQSALPTGQTLKQPIGAGPGAIVGANTQRYFGLYFRPSATIATGALTCTVNFEALDSHQFTPIGSEVIG